MRVKPAEGLRVPYEDKPGFVEPEGEDLPVTSFIIRRLRDGELLRVEPPAEDEPAGEPPAESDQKPRPKATKRSAK